MNFKFQYKHNTLSRLIMIPLSILIIYSLLAPVVYAKEGVVVYSSRTEDLIKPLFKAFQEETGVEVHYQTGNEGALIERLKQEGSSTPADLLMLVDAGNLWYAGSQGVLDEVESKHLLQNIPAQYRDPGNQWFGLSIRARTIVYSTKRVDPGKLTNYEDLAKPEWKNRLCVRTSKKIYNKSLIASFIHHYGEKETERIVKGWVNNLAERPFAKDSHVIKSIASGACDIGIVNTYYFGRAESKNPNIPVAIFWPDKKGYGVHVNISGAGITRYAPHRKEALLLLNWMVSETAQKILSGMNKEYPVRKDVDWDPQVAAWGTFRADTMNLAETGKRQADAVRLMQRSKYK